MKKTLIILTFNEIEASPKIYDKIPFDSADEVIIIDGGSKDGTIEWFEKKGRRVVVQTERGRGNAFILASKEAKGEHIVFFSPDGNEDPGDIPKLFKCLEDGADLAIASRMMKGAFNEEDVDWIRLRKWVNQAFTLIANVFWNRGPYVTDTINGFRGLTKKTFKEVGLDAAGFVIEYQMSIRSMKRGLKIVEIPTREGQRLGGESTAKSLPTGILFIKQLFKEIALGKNF